MGQPMMKDILYGFVRQVILVVLCAVLAIIVQKISDGTSFMDTIQSLSRTGQASYSSYERQAMSQLIAPDSIQVRLSDIGGIDAIKADLQTTVILPLQHPDCFFGKNVRLTTSRGVLLVGPPGTGKTMLARAIAKECGVPFLSVSVSQIESKWYGESAKLLDAVFSVARRIQPSVIFIDEIDGILRQRCEDDAAAAYGLKTQMLTLLDGMASTSRDQFVVIASTNMIDSLDPALRRRLPKVIHVPLPNEAARRDIFSKITDAETCVDAQDITYLSERTKGFSGSDIAAVYTFAKEARIRASIEDAEFQSCLRRHDAEGLDRVLLPITREMWDSALLACGPAVSNATQRHAPSSLLGKLSDMMTHVSQLGAGDADDAASSEDAPQHGDDTLPIGGVDE